MNIWGNNLRLSIFGESHAKGIGITIDGLPSGIKLNWSQIAKDMKRRRPNNKKYSTKRNEKDEIEIICGVVDDITTGAPITAIIYNKDVKSKSYEKLKYVPRPNHADYPAYIKFDGFNDIRGGGHFSGRLTAPLTFAGSIARDLLSKQGINIISHISQIGDIKDINYTDYIDISNKEFPTLNDEIGKNMQDFITNLDGDSVGGAIELIATGIKPGVGEPFFNSLESVIAHLMFSVPAVKGVEFGIGFDFVNHLGSEVSDTYYYDEEIKIKNNNNGGILGGLSTGAPIIVRVAIKPTPSIAKKLHSVNLKTCENVDLIINGRHDPCIVPRAVVVVESVLALAILECML